MHCYRLPRTIGGALLVTALVVPSAAAQPRAVQPSPAAPEPLMPTPEAFNITPFVGFDFGGNLENTPATFGVALGCGLTTRFAIEGELSAAPGAEQGVITQFDTSLWSLSGSLL